MQGGRMTDPDGIRSSVRVLRPCGANRPIEWIREEVFAGLRFDGHELAPVIRLQSGLEPFGVDAFGPVDDQFRIGRDYETPSCEPTIRDCTLSARIQPGLVRQPSIAGLGDARIRLQHSHPGTEAGS